VARLEVLSSTCGWPWNQTSQGIPGKGEDPSFKERPEFFTSNGNGYEIQGEWETKNKQSLLLYCRISFIASLMLHLGYHFWGSWVGPSWFPGRWGDPKSSSSNCGSYEAFSILAAHTNPVSKFGEWGKG